MPVPPLSFDIRHRDGSAASHARVGVVTTPHGSFDTPAFMPVGTQGSVKGILHEQLVAIGAQIILGNTYHLMLRPGPERVAQMGGLQHWTRWRRPMLTDSGGYQVFSLADINRINDDGVRFKSHLDGRMIDLTPERSMVVQNALGADVIMAFDDCPPSREAAGGQGPGAGGKAGGEAESGASSSAEHAARLDLANERTLRWLERCLTAHGRAEEQALFPIVQGGVDLDKRTWCVQRVLDLAPDCGGYAIGGVAVGEGPDEIRTVVEHTAPLLPEDRPRYLMGVGYERDLVTAVRAGVDMFDCVLPTRNGRNASAFTRTGSIRLKNARFADDPGPIDPACPCPVCREHAYSRSYLRHLFMAGEMLGPILVSLHNLAHFQALMLDIRHAIRDSDWSGLWRDWPVAAGAPDRP